MARELPACYLLMERKSLEKSGCGFEPSCVPWGVTRCSFVIATACQRSAVPMQLILGLTIMCSNILSNAGY